MKIARRPIGPDYPPFVIAQMSGNHNQSLGPALAPAGAIPDATAATI